MGKLVFGTPYEDMGDAPLEGPQPLSGPTTINSPPRNSLPPNNATSDPAASGPQFRPRTEAGLSEPKPNMKTNLKGKKEKGKERQTGEHQQHDRHPHSHRYLRTSIDTILGSESVCDDVYGGEDEDEGGTDDGVIPKFVTAEREGVGGEGKGKGERDREMVFAGSPASVGSTFGVNNALAGPSTPRASGDGVRTRAIMGSLAFSRTSSDLYMASDESLV